MSRVFIGLGSNVGDRLRLISEAVRRLGTVEGIRVTQLAPIIESAPLGGPPQGPYLNTVAELDTALEPRNLLILLKQIERQLGRPAGGPRWGPRPIDLDVLLYGDRIIEEPDLQVPHPRLHERWFVLAPLSQLAPDAVHPVLRQSVADLFHRLPAPAVEPSAP